MIMAKSRTQVGPLRNSSFIDGVGDDAWVIAEQIAGSGARVRVAQGDVDES
jgi:hypothetical protein